MVHHSVSCTDFRQRELSSLKPPFPFLPLGVIGDLFEDKFALFYEFIRASFPDYQRAFVVTTSSTLTGWALAR